MSLGGKVPGFAQLRARLTTLPKLPSPSGGAVIVASAEAPQFNTMTVVSAYPALVVHPAHVMVIEGSRIHVRY